MTTVLVIEDDPPVLEIERTMLEESGYRVVTGLGEGALRIAQRERPDLILLDMLMPGMDGWAIRECLLKHPATKDIPVIVLTALPRGTWRAENMRAETVIQKPFDLGDLARAVRDAVGESTTAGTSRGIGDHQ